MIRLFGDSIFRGSAVTMRPDLKDEVRAAKVPLWPLRWPASVMNLVLGGASVSVAGRLRLPEGIKASLRDLQSAFESGTLGPDDVLIMLDVGEHKVDPDAHEDAWRQLRRAATRERPTRLLICEGFDNGAGGKLAYRYDVVFGRRSINQAIRDAALEPQPTYVGSTEFVPLSQPIARYHRWLDERFGVSAYRSDGIHLNVWDNSAFVAACWAPCSLKRPSIWPGSSRCWPRWTRIWNCTGRRCGRRWKRRSIQQLELGGAPYRTRTCDPLLRRQMLYPAELRAPTSPLATPHSRRGPAQAARAAEPRRTGA